MKIIIHFYSILMLMLVALPIRAQNVGIGTLNPSTALEVVGTIKANSLQFTNTNTGIGTLPNGILDIHSSESIRFNAGIGGSLNNSISIFDNNSLWATFQGSDRRLGLRTNVPTESIHTLGGLRIGNADNTNEGTIRWDGNDFCGYDGFKWKSFVKGTELLDEDADTRLYLSEAPYDAMVYIANDINYKQEITNASGTQFSYLSDATLGVNESITQKYFLGGTTTGIINVSAPSPGFFNITGDDRVFIAGAYNDGANNKINVSIGKHFTSYGTVINRGGSPVGNARGLLDVRGTIYTDTITIQDIVQLTPIPKPINPTAGLIYMDDGTCNACGGTPTLRYHNGTNWVNL